MVASAEYPWTDFPYAIEIQADFKDFNIVRQDIEEYFAAHSVEFSFAVEPPTKIIVGFPDEADACAFHAEFSGRFIELSSCRK